MLRSRISRANSKLEIFIGIVDCRQKKIPIIFKISFTWFAFHIFTSFISRQNHPPFYRLTAPCPYASERSCPLFPWCLAQNDLYFSWDLGFFKSLKYQTPTLEIRIYFPFIKRLNVIFDCKMPISQIRRCSGFLLR